MKKLNELEAAADEAEVDLRLPADLRRSPSLLPFPVICMLDAAWGGAGGGMLLLR